MPNFKSHIFWIFVITVFIGFIIIFKDIKYGLIPLIIYVFGTLPDIDCWSKLRTKILKIFFLILILSAIIYLWLGMKYMLVWLTVSGVLGFTMLKLKHRGMMHKYSFGILLSLPLLYLGVIFMLIGLASYSSHILLDKLTRKRNFRGRLLRKIFKIWD